MCENIEIDKINTKEVGIDKYWLILREFAPAVADCLAFDQLVLSFKEFEDNEAIDRSELLPVSNKEAFSYLTQFRDDELRFALASLSDNPVVLYDLYNIIMDGEYEAYKQCLSKNNISTYLLNKRLALYVLNIKSLNEGMKAVNNALSKTEGELVLEDYAYINKMKTASPNFIDERMDNIFSMIETAEKDECISEEQMMRCLEYPLFLIKFTIKETLNKEAKSLNPYEKQLLALRLSPCYAILENFHSCLEDAVLKLDMNNLWSVVNVIQEYNESLDVEADNKPKAYKNTGEFSIQVSPIPGRKRLDFPSRLSAEKLMSPSPISAQEQGAVLREIYNLYGGAFDNMSCEEFLYLLGAAFVKQPTSYNPPYYWTGNVSTMKALIRILYIQQPRILKELILHISDKATGKTSHDWGRNKDSVAYQDIEENIIAIIRRITGKTLKEL